MILGRKLKMNKKDCPLITVGIPVYNRELLITKCIQSVLNQTYSNFEIILVDDGSTDNSLEICKSFESSDNRIRIISQKNSGVSTARNQVIKSAKGDYICFIDSDDFVESDLLQTYVTELEKQDYDLIICGFKNSTADGTLVYYELSDFDLTDINEFWKQFGYLLARNLLRSPVNKLYKTSILKENNLLFDISTQIAEDAIFNADYYNYIKSIRIVNKPLYNVLLHDSENRLSNKVHKSFFESQNKLFTKYVALLKSKNCFEGNNKEVLDFQFANLITKGMKDICLSEKKLPVSEVNKNIVPDVFPIDKKEHFYFGKVEKSFNESRYEKVIPLILLRSKIGFCYNVNQFIKEKSFLKKILRLSKIIIWSLLIPLESISKIKICKNIEVI